MRRFALLALVATLAAAPTALAGGDWLPVAATAGRVWVADGGRVLELDAATGRILHSAPTRYPYATDLALGAGSAWAASVVNGYTAGAVTRVRFGESRGTNVLVQSRRAVYWVVSDGTAAWALTGPHPHQRLARVDAASGRVGFTPVPSTLAFIAADPTGAVAGLYALTSRHVVLRYDAAGHATRLARVVSASAPPAVGLGGVWLPGRSTLVRLDARTGRVEGRLRVAGSESLTAVVGAGAVWLLELHGNRLALLRVDPDRMRVTGRAPLPGLTGERLAAGAGFLWLTDSSHRLWRVDPATLDRVLFAMLP